MSSPARLEFTEGDIKTCGLTAYVEEDGRLQLGYQTDGKSYFCTLDTKPEYRVVNSNMPVGVLVAFLHDTRERSTEDAMLSLPKRLRAYVSRRKQVEACQEEHADRLVGGKIETTALCTYVQVRLRVKIGEEWGVVQLELSYGEYSVHPIRYVISTSGSDYFHTSVEQSADAIANLLQSRTLSDVCAELLS